MPARTPGSLKFGRGARIKKGADFRRLREHGRRLVSGCLIGNWEILPEHSRTRVGIITSGKIGNAVVRNRARRLLRESFRLHQHELAHALDLVLIARQSITAKDFHEVEHDYLALLRKAGLLASAEANR